MPSSVQLWYTVYDIFSIEKNEPLLEQGTEGLHKKWQRYDPVVIPVGLLLQRNVVTPMSDMSCYFEKIDSVNQH